MIPELIEFGKWLDSNGFDDFGKLIKNDDRIINIKINITNDNFDFSNIEQKINDFLDNPDSQENYKNFIDNREKGISLFSNELFFETNQNIMIPSNAALACLTPFVLSLKRITKKKIENSKKQNVDRNGEFVNLFSELEPEYEILKEYYSKYSKENIIEGNNDLFNKTLNNIDELKDVLKKYYNLLLDKWELIEKLKESIANKDPDIFIYFELPEKYILLNDIIYFYCKYLKLREETTESLKSHKCQFCGSNEVTYPRFSAINLGKSYNWNYNRNLENSKINICKNCSAYLYLGIQKLIHVFENNFILIPKLKNEDYSKFELITEKINTYYNNIGEYKSKFRLLNQFLSEKDFNADFNFDFLIFEKTRMGEDVKTITKYVENYKAFLAQFENGINLYDNDKLIYLFDEKKIFKDDKNDITQIKNVFDIESLFKSFFNQIDDGKVSFPNFFYFYEIYSKSISDISGKWDSKTKSIFAKYMHSIFNYIYELNAESLTLDMLNEIALNYFIQLEKNVEEPVFKILKNLNYYFLIKNEFIGEKMLKKEDMNKLKEYFNEYDNAKDNEILKIIDSDEDIKYYLLGQFIRLIDNSKGYQNKNGVVFSNFVKNVNRNNIKNLFVTEILQKNDHYIGKMNIKGKFIFKMLENDIGNFLNKSNKFEDYLILIFTGYYTKNILSSNDDKNKDKENKK
ncbi:MAG: hypothetical protein LBM96_00575 [Methanobrevibacter sp.]|jgi:CRISPR-associated protein Csh1|nr:hypothetical protein [Candidatus Methanoflexus mossambicus]